jgi:hypothetical protein
MSKIASSSSERRQICVLSYALYLAIILLKEEKKPQDLIAFLF